MLDWNHNMKQLKFKFLLASHLPSLTIQRNEIKYFPFHHIKRSHECESSLPRELFDCSTHDSRMQLSWNVWECNLRLNLRSSENEAKRHIRIIAQKKIKARSCMIAITKYELICNFPISHPFLNPQLLFSWKMNKFFILSKLRDVCQRRFLQIHQTYCMCEVLQFARECFQSFKMFLFDFLVSWQ